MFRRILVPLDGSSFAEAALTAAASLVRRWEGELRLVSVLESQDAVGRDRERREIEEYLADVRKRATPGWYGTITTVVREGDPAEQIGAELERWNADLIVMATHGRGGLSRAWMGSVADACIRVATRPILAIRPAANGAHASTLTAASVVIPLDGSDLAEAALPHGMALARHLGVPVTLLRAVPHARSFEFYYLPETIAMSRQIDEEERDRASRYLEKVVAQWAGSGVEVSGLTINDVSAAESILSRATGNLVVMTTHGRGGIDRLLLGSVTDKVLRGGEGAVLVIPPRAQAQEKPHSGPRGLPTPIHPLPYEPPPPRPTNFQTVIHRPTPRNPMRVAASLPHWSLALVAGVVGASSGRPATLSEPETVRLVLQEGSRLWLEGDSNLRRWSCDAKGFVPELRLERAGPGGPPSRITQADLLVPVGQIQCGIGKMNENLRTALKAETYPNIVFELTTAEVLDTGVRGTIAVTAHGQVRVAGITRPITLQVTGRDTGSGSLRLEGKVSILMTQYGIKPPTAMLGLLRTKDEVIIRFDLMAGYEQLETALS